MSSVSPRLPRLFTIPEAAEYLRVCVKTVRRMVKAGVLPAHLVGSQYRIAEFDLGTYVASIKR